MAQSIKLGSNTYLDASGIVMSDHSTLDTAHSTASGDYMQYPDGTMIAWGSSTIPANGDRTQIVYPKAFNASAKVFFTAVENGYSNVGITLVAWQPYANSVYALLRSQTLSVAINFSWIAIGRWK